MIFFKVKTCKKIIPSDGDCFYRAVVEAFKLNGDDVRNYETVFTETHDEGVISLRRTAAMGLTEEVFQDFRTYKKAGLKDYKFMTGVASMEKLKNLMMLSGLKVGPKKCLWANEFEIGVVC